MGILHLISQRSDLSWAFVDELRGRGWVEGRNLIVEEGVFPLRLQADQLIE